MMPSDVRTLFMLLTQYRDELADDLLCLDSSKKCASSLKVVISNFETVTEYVKREGLNLQ